MEKPKRDIKRSSPLHLIRFEGCERAECDTDSYSFWAKDKTLKPTDQFVPKSVSLSDLLGRKFVKNTTIFSLSTKAAVKAACFQPINQIKG